ncbi:FkbM family methyltransferase [Gammaproteobacteria bacterium]|nr:FkbM family methyltransferase [Gammaproteobacteria bacterium]
MISGSDLSHDLQAVIQKKSPIIFDVGANIGQSIELFTTVFQSPVIYSFEPSEPEFLKLRERYKKSSNVSMYQYAMGAKNTEAEFLHYDKSVMNSFYEIDNAEENRKNFKRLSVTSRSQVKVVTLDSLAKDFAIEKIDLLKSDTQGYEMEVLKGAENSLHRGIIDNVLIEVNLIPMYVNQAEFTEIYNYLHRMNFRLVDFYEKKRSRKSIDWATALFMKID